MPQSGAPCQGHWSCSLDHQSELMLRTGKGLWNTMRGQGICYFCTSYEMKNRSPCHYLQSSGGHDSVGVWAEAPAVPPSTISGGWQRHWGGSRLPLSLYLPRNSASLWGQPVVGYGLAHGTTPPHGGLNWIETAREKKRCSACVCVGAGRRSVCLPSSLRLRGPKGRAVGRVLVKGEEGVQQEQSALR